MTDRYTFNQFQKELRDRNIDRQTAYMLSVVYEQHIEVLKQVELMATILNSVVDTVASFAALHEATQGKVMDLNKMMTGEVEGVTVTTEPGKGN